MDNEEINAFDALMPEETELDLRIQQNGRLDNRVAYLTHKIFSQTAEGVELLETWKDTTLMKSVERSDLYNLGKLEGWNEFVRDLIRTINQVENEDV